MWPALEPSGYTLLRIDAQGRLLMKAWHLQRLGASAQDELERFVAGAPPGIYRVAWNGQRLETSQRAQSRLMEGMPTRFVVSPVALHRGRIAKRPPPSEYDDVRVDGVASLLTDRAGTVIHEACSAAVVGWNGRALVLPPLETPCVDSVAERALTSRIDAERAPLRVADGWPLILINAVVGTCAVEIEGRAPFPAEERQRIDLALQQT